MNGGLHIGLDVAQTCSERAGCAWLADSTARALVGAGAGHRFSLYHHFGSIINTDTTAGTRLSQPNVSSPMAGLSAAEAALLWDEVQGSRRELPDSPDLVHSMSFQAPLIRGVPLVTTIHDVSFWVVPEYGTEVNRLNCQGGTLAALARASGFIFPSEFSRSEFEVLFPDWLRTHGRPCAVVRPAPRFPVAAGRRTPDEAAPWLFVGTLEPRKNLETALRAHAAYWERSALRRPLVVVGGEGWASAQVRRQIGEMERAGRVSRRGYLPDAELHELYCRAFGFVFPSWYEGFGLPVLEAAAQGTPALCSRAASLPEAAGPGALYFDPHSSRELTERMLELEQSPSQWLDLSRAALGHAGQASWRRAAAETLAFYETVRAAWPRGVV